MRYTGQGWEIPITLTQDQAMAPDASVFLTLFEAEYSKLFGRTVQGLDVEITVWSVNATTPPEAVAQVAQDKGSSVAVIDGKCAFFDAAVSDNVNGYRFDRDGMKAGSTADGPAIITEEETSIIVPSSRSVVSQPDGCVDMIRKEASQ